MVAGVVRVECAAEPEELRVSDFGLTGSCFTMRQTDQGLSRSSRRRRLPCETNTHLRVSAGPRPLT
jgi:hypothetical protein